MIFRESIDSMIQSTFAYRDALSTQFECQHERDAAEEAASAARKKWENSYEQTKKTYRWLFREFAKTGAIPALETLKMVMDELNEFSTGIAESVLRDAVLPNAASARHIRGRVTFEVRKVDDDYLVEIRADGIGTLYSSLASSMNYNLGLRSAAATAFDRARSELRDVASILEEA